MGEKLLDDVAVATGLPQDLVSQELLRLITGAGVAPEELTLESLRQILAEYVQDVLLEVKEEMAAANGK